MASRWTIARGLRPGHMVLEGTCRKGAALQLRHGIEHHGFELPDVAGKGVSAQQGKQIRRKLRNGFSQGFGRLLEEVAAQQRQVFVTLPQGRDPYPMGTKTIVQIGAELFVCLYDDWFLMSDATISSPCTYSFTDTR